MFSNLKAEIARKDLSMRELANLLKISRTTLREKLQGMKDFNIAEIERILRIFPECSFEYLFGGDIRKKR